MRKSTECQCEREVLLRGLVNCCINLNMNWSGIVPSAEQWSQTRGASWFSACFRRGRECRVDMLNFAARGRGRCLLTGFDGVEDAAS